MGNAEKTDRNPKATGTLVIPAKALRGLDLTKVTPAMLAERAIKFTGNQEPSAGKRASCRVPAKGQTYHTEGIPNGLEAAYAQYLEGLLSSGKILFWMFERVRLTLARKTTYLPDFFVVRADGSAEFHETKGFWRDDARAKIKIAAQEFPCFGFVAVQRNKDTGAWEFERFYPCGIEKAEQEA
ncbi:hypothetical protein [Desulfovibrio sp. ZJ200]|uniref:hypothetical protein n=1 Tax=Desulfovibrio sp. ZJ200 TaxID=2709792 RepID=UPI001F15492B|nr:hypothetical protein [Desulfovibrio sp. ZJ200]